MNELTRILMLDQARLRRAVFRLHAGPDEFRIESRLKRGQGCQGNPLTSAAAAAAAADDLTRSHDAMGSHNPAR